MTTFEWMPSRGPHHNYVYHGDTEGMSRSTVVAGAEHCDGHYRVDLSYHFNELVPSTAYILKRKFPTLEAAKRAVERKVPGLVAVLKIQGVTI
jgi:hypothetical protein